jgi:hypothetical protein
MGTNLHDRHSKMKGEILMRPRCRWKDNIKMDLKEQDVCELNLNGSGQGPVAGSCEHT